MPVDATSLASLPPGARVLFITVNYRGATDTLEFLASVRALHAFGQLHVIVVDNASGDGSVDRLSAAVEGLPNVRIIASDYNRGYFGAARWAVEEYSRSGHALPDWIVVCNNDIVLPDPDFVALLQRHDCRAVGVIAPAILASSSGRDQNPFMASRPNRRALLGIRLWLGTYAIHYLRTVLSQTRAGLLRALPVRSGVLRGLSPIYAPHGAAIIFSNAYFREGGFLDDSVLLYAEEFSVGELCHRMQLPVIHDPAVVVEHHEHSSTGRMLTRQAYIRKKEALDYVVKRYLVDLV